MSGVCKNAIVGNYLAVVVDVIERYIVTALELLWHVQAGIDIASLFNDVGTLIFKVN